MADKMWFGHARGHMQYVPCPLIDSSVTRNRYLERIQFENGGGDGRRSNQYQMQYDFQFSGLAHEVDGIDAFNKYAQGFYGDDLIHLAHPAAFETNLFPAGWATPSLAEKGWGKISSDAVAYSNADGPMYTNLVTNPSMEGVTAGTDSTKRTNLVTNPSVEVDTTGWTTSGGTIARVTTQAYVGTASLELTANSYNGALYDVASVAASQTYTSSVWVKGTAGDTALLELSERTSGGATVGTTSGTVTTLTGFWQRLTVTRTFGSTGVNARLIIRNTSATSSPTYWDALMLEAASEARSYFDGTYAEDPTLIEAWTGTVNNSTSTALVRGVSNRENLVTNPNFTVDINGWTPVASGTTLTRDTTEFYTGTASLKAVCDGATYSQGPYLTTSPSGLSVGQKFSVSAWVKAPLGVSLSLFAQSYGGGIVYTPLVGTGNWQYVKAQNCAVGTGLNVIVGVLSPSAQAMTFYVDSAMIELGTTVGPYFDGSYTDAPGWTTSWAGTANASRSVATAAPVTVRTNLVTNPSMESVTPGSVVMRRNLMYNASMISSTGVMPDGMVAYTTGGSTGTRSTVSGSSSTTISGATLPSTGSVFGHYYPSSGTLSGLGRTMTISATVSGITGTNVRATMYVDFVDAQGWIGTALFNTTTNGRFSGTTTLSRTPIGLSAFVWVESLSGSVTGAGATFSDLLIEQGTVAGTFFSGATTAAQGWTYAWSGAANASISTAACAATTVRTNLSVDPAATANIGAGSTLRWAPQWFGSGGAGTTSVITGQTGPVSGLTTAMRKTWTTVGSAALDISYNFSGSGTSGYPVTAGTTYAVSMYYRTSWSNIGSTQTNNGLYFNWYNSAGTLLSNTSIASVPHVGANVWTRVSAVQTAPANAAYVTISHQFYTSILPSIGSTFDGTGLLVETSSVVGDYFDGSFQPAGDFSYAWGASGTGTANASTSIARGATVASYTPFNAGAVASREWMLTGNQSLRIVPTGAASYAAPGGEYIMALGMTAGNTYTVSGTIRLAAAQTGTLHPNARKISFIYKNSGGTYVEATSTQAANSAGVTRLSVTVAIPAGATEAFVRLYNGAPVGGGDVWWDDVLVEASPIVQDYFDGSVVSADADLTNSWSGTPHASTSLKRGVGAATVSYFNAAAIQSSGWASTGTKSVRVIPTATSNSSAGYFAVPTTVGQTYTVKGVVRLVAPQTGVISGPRIAAYDGAISTQLGVSTALPNVAGVTNLSFTFVATTTTSHIIFYNGASAGGGDVWFDNFMVVAGTYTGSYFDGNSTDSGNTTYSWTGTANASTSTSLSEMVLYGNPPRATTYTVTNINQPPTKVCTLVIPPEYTLYLGASGTSTGSAGVFIRPIQASDSLYYGPTEELTLLDPNGSVRMNKTLNGATYQAVEIFLMKTDAAAATVTLNSMMAQLYKTGTTPALPTNHYQGEGSTGLMFADDAIVETYQYMHPPRKGIATTLIEVEAWR